MAIKVRNGKQERVVEEENKNFPTHGEKNKTFTPLVLQSYDDSHMTSPSDWEVYEVNINDIEEKANNNFIKANIEKLAESIKEIGLSQPIVIKSIGRNEEMIEKFEVVAGHRRLEAYKYLNEKYKNKYLKINAYILKKGEEEKEERIYLETNSHSRNICLIEALLNCGLENIDFNNHEFKEEYDNLFYPDGFITRKEKYNQESKVRYLERKIKDNFPNLEDISNKSIWNNYILLTNLEEVVIKALLDGKIGINKARVIAKYPKDRQKEALEALLAQKPLPNIGDSKAEKNKVIETKDYYYNEMLKIDKRLKQFTLLSLDRIKTDDWTANAKAYYKQMDKVLKEINKLEAMPKK